MPSKPSTTENHEHPKLTLGTVKHKRPESVRTPSASRIHAADMTRFLKPTSEGNLGPPKPQCMEDIDDIGVLAVLQEDERPTFIVDLDNAINEDNGSLYIMFTNNALKAKPELLEQIIGRSLNGSPAFSIDAFATFKRWVVDPAKDHDICPFGGVVWRRSTFNRHIRMCHVYTVRMPLTPRDHPAASGHLRSGSFTKKENDMNKRDAPSSDQQDYFGAAVALERKHSRVLSLDKAGKTRTEQPKKATRPPVSPGGSKSTTHALPSHRKHAPSNDDDHNFAKTIDEFQATPKDNVLNFDWTLLLDVSHLSPHIQFVKNIDWSKNKLGPMEAWSPALRQAVNLIMACPYPAAMYWGEDLIQLYNESYIALAGPKHPWLMGIPYKQGWGEIWEFLKGRLHEGIKEGKSTTGKADRFFISRHQSHLGKLEECFFDWALIPILASDGSVAGLYNPAFEQTQRLVSERRMYTYQEIGNLTANVSNLKKFWKGLLKGLEYNNFDNPFAMVYSVQDEIDSDSAQSSLHSGGDVLKQLCLEGSIGIPEDHPILLEIIDIQSGFDPMARMLRGAKDRDDASYLSVDLGTLDPVLLKGIKGRGFDDTHSALVICPLFLPNGTQPLGFLITGVNTRRPFDEDYRLYISVLSRQLATTMASIVLHEEEVARSKRAAQTAAQQQVVLSEKLKVTTEQATETEARFTRLTELNPVGLFIADPKGRLTYCNEKWYETMCTTEADLEGDQWMNIIVQEDRIEFMGVWKRLVEDGLALDAEIRLDAAWTHGGGGIGETWAVVKARPYRDAAGKIKSLLGCIADISPQKWAEHLEKLRTEEAVVRKQEQERFIDMTSHEMRNPLSSILQCADEIAVTAAEQLALGGLKPEHEKAFQLFSLVSNTLSVCGQHEKRIVDDILTLSKMEAGKLKVSPEAADPRELIAKAETMFTFDMKYHGIKLDVEVDQSYLELSVRYVKLDPSRVLAVLVNLTTNSIKFTSKEQERRITITLGASAEPGQRQDGLRFVPVLENYEDPTASKEWGDGPSVYIHYSVTDTGKGLTREEISGLFRRFSQASDSTHVKYGGSGLGLYIARLLAELCGGQIGVSSVPGKGSTFAFYVKAKFTTEQPPHTISKHYIKPQTQVNVLLVEDNEIVAATAARNLRKYAFRVHIAVDGGQCLEFLKRSIRFGRHIGEGSRKLESERGRDNKAADGKDEKGNRVLDIWTGPRAGTHRSEAQGMEERQTSDRGEHGDSTPCRTRTRPAMAGRSAYQMAGASHSALGTEEIAVDVILMDQQMPVMDGITTAKFIRQWEQQGYLVGHVPIIATTANARSQQQHDLLAAGMDDVVSKPFVMGEILPKMAELIAKFS